MQTYLEALDIMREAGGEHGKFAASWYFDGNTRQDVYAAVLRGIEEGDPEILETFPSSPLSGEWAGDPIPDSVLEENLDWWGVDWEDDLLTAYEDGFNTAVHNEIERVARLQLA